MTHLYRWQMQSAQDIWNKTMYLTRVFIIPSGFKEWNIYVSLITGEVVTSGWRSMPTRGRCVLQDPLFAFLCLLSILQMWLKILQISYLIHRWHTIEIIENGMDDRIMIWNMTCSWNKPHSNKRKKLLFWFKTNKQT